ncbi:MAG TPA: isoaspartyl peptidase/L-asparaginase [Caulobacteraceae bacterium]|jgi:beta-aspartyl-peptidase (threonine type)|nr:isoaspartyl peptidase/L-asparaginase [Caulobacteraceae bacterium]
MRALLAGLALALAIAGVAGAAPKWAIAIHGGAGVIERGKMAPAQESAYRKAMADALEAGSAVLRTGGSALDAVETVIKRLEDDPLFNAGRGAVFTADGRNELDAAVMDGATLKAGAVAGVTRTRHPISLARAVMERSKHVMLVGAGADAFAREQGLEQVEPGFFFTERRWRELEAELRAQGLPIPPRPPGTQHAADAGVAPDDHRFGTVGVAALDARGDVAAGTSTGGLTAKRWGRVGDSPIIGAGTYANLAEGCAVSATGTGEYFIRLTIARDVCARHAAGATLQQAADAEIQKALTAAGGDGGLIAVAPDGEIAWSYNTSGMYRASAADGRAPSVAIYKDEP